MKRLIFISIVSTIVAASASAQTLFDQSYGGYNGDNGAFSQDPGQNTADNFSPSISGTVGAATWWGNFLGQGSPYSDGTQLQFGVRFYKDAGGTPDTTAFFDSNVLGTLKAVDSAEGDKIYQIDASFAGPSLTATAPYYFQVVMNDSNVRPDQFRWNNFTTTDGDHYFRSDNTSTWNVESGLRGNSAFALYAVPEPFSMVAFGAAGLLALRKRRAR